MKEKRRVAPKLIHCIGDSHVNFFSGVDRMQNSWPNPSWTEHPTFITYRLGPVLAYNLVKLNTKTRGREKLFKVVTKLPRNSKVLLCFGEIDCRAHLLKQAKLQQRPVDQLIKECVARYISAALEIKALGHEVIIWNVVPSSPKAINSTEFPSYGNPKERALVTQLFNDALAKACGDHGLLFASIYDKLIKPNGLPNLKFFRDQIHLSQSAFPFAKHALEQLMPGFTVRTKYNSKIDRTFARIRYFIRYYLHSIKNSVYIWMVEKKLA
jgi:hypothetical protein